VGWLSASALVPLLTIAVYSPALYAGFVGDDFMILHRLRALGGLADATRFFRGEFFEYYRPLAFVSHAVDWSIAGADPRQFHVTNLALHIVNTMLVLLVGRALAPGSAAGPLAALLFALHAANHEAVFWMSARFDLLATCGALAAVWWMVRRGRGETWIPALLFFPALLSKESVVALPIAAAAWTAFRLRETTAQTIARAVPWIVALGAYAALRQLAGGVPAAGGAGRLPKLAIFGFAMLLLIAAADGRWLRLRQWLRERKAVVAWVTAFALLVAAAAAAASDAWPGQLAREKLSVAGFAIFYLVSPVVDVTLTPFYLDPATPVYWLGGLAALLAVGLILWFLWSRVLDDERLWFLGALLVATLIPVSALTEGKRYLYLPSAVASLAVALLVSRHARADRLRQGCGGAADRPPPEAAVRRSGAKPEARACGRGARRVLIGALAAYAIVSAGQIWRKGADWVWAGRMTADGARLVDTALAPGCGDGHVVFLTSPVAVRGVYTHFYYETFELPRGCMPAVFQVLVRVMRLDTTVDARWESPARISITAPRYGGNFVLSRDLRHFDIPLRASRTALVETPLGELRAEPAGDGERLTLTLSSKVRRDAVQFFYYSDGRIRKLPVSD
jgi:hypothetical protein